MDKQKLIIQSLAMDLKRVALGLHNHSYKVAERFKEESLKRQEELERQELDDYLRYLIKKSKQSLINNDDQTAEDALMYSTLFQNYVIRKFGVV